MWAPVRVRGISVAYLFLVSIPLLATTSELPYNPTQLLLANYADTAYIIQPTSSGFELGSIHLTSTIVASNLTIRTIQSPISVLPGPALAISSAIDADGTITLYAGNCSEPAASSQVWSLSTSKIIANSAPWTVIQAGVINSGIPSSNFLASTISFPGNMSSPVSYSKMYVFGGMCPNSSSTLGSWQVAAQYTNSMLQLSISNSSKDITYSAEVSSNSNNPIAQAGHSLTPLTPVFANTADGKQQQQQSFIAIGGHTNTAWMNMSQLAVFSLPQSTWTYVSATISPTISTFNPRSGHSAVLSSDGTKVIVYGGWVGDVDSAAVPQLLVLNVGSAYGGSGDWSWTAPVATGDGPSSGSSLYGHGAIMLPGNIMMIIGGYSLSQTASRIKRDITQQANTRAYLYNVSSNTWITEYSAPASAFKPSSSPPPNNSGVSEGVRLGVGVGTAGAIVVLLCVTAIFMYHRKKQRKAREHRADELRYSQGFVSDEWGVLQYNDKTPEHRSSPEMATYHPSYSQSNPGAPKPSPVPKKPAPARYNQLRPKQRQIRKNGSRSGYAYERSARKTPAFKPIESITEGVEEATNEKTSPQPSENQEAWEPTASEEFMNGLGITKDESRNSERPRSGGRSVADILEEETGAEIFDIPRHAAEGGRTSPSKSERTTSSLSTMSAVSSQGLLQTLSRGSVLLGINTLKSPFSTGPNSYGSSSPEHPETPTDIVQSMTATQTSADVISAIPRGGDTIHRRPSRVKIPQEAPELQEEHQQSPKRQSAIGGLLGRLPFLPSGMRSVSLTSAMNRPKSQIVENKMISFGQPGGSMPRRSASDASVWSSKRGAKDWGEDENDEEWEPERIILNRAVQTMYTTVPRGTLRVVNPDDERADALSFTDEVERLDVKRGGKMD